jgi:polyphenol oxidase
VVFVADCLPVMLVAEGAVAALHGGWRGLAAGIVDEGVRALREVGGTGPITAALGPSARGCCYEVGEEVHAHFPGARVGERNLDLARVAREQLAAAGVETVHDTGLCTMCSDPGLFFSHRRDGGVTGRQGGVVVRR